MLEDHLVPFVRKWQTASGIYGEQGIESLHKEFNAAYRFHNALKPQEKRLEKILHNHVVERNSVFQALAVSAKKRKLSAAEE